MAKKRRKKRRIRWNRVLILLLAIFLVLYALYYWVVDPILDYYTTPIVAVEPTEVYGVPVTTDFLEEGAFNRPGIKREIKYIVIHETGNSDYGSTAKNHSVYLHKYSDVTNSWHYTVDDTEIYHHLPDDEVGWHASDGLEENGGNLNGIGIEICVNEEGDFDQAVENAAKLTAYLMHAYRLDMDDIKQHADFTKKNCPETLRNTGQWDDFLELVKKYY